MHGSAVFERDRRAMELAIVRSPGAATPRDLSRLVPRYLQERRAFSGTHLTETRRRNGVRSPRVLPDESDIRAAENSRVNQPRRKLRGESSTRSCGKTHVSPGAGARKNVVNQSGGGPRHREI